LLLDGASMMAEGALSVVGWNGHNIPIVVLDPNPKNTPIDLCQSMDQATRSSKHDTKYAFLLAIVLCP
jgi:hypothetical protein